MSTVIGTGSAEWGAAPEEGASAPAVAAPVIPAPTPVVVDPRTLEREARQERRAAVAAAKVAARTAAVAEKADAKSVVATDKAAARAAKLAAVVEARTAKAEAKSAKTGARAAKRGTKRAPREAKAAPARRNGDLAIGAAPRVDLMPTSIQDRQRQKRMRRGLRTGIVAVAVLVLGGIVGAMALNASAQGELAAAQDETLNLLTQRGQFSDLVATQQGIALGQAAEAVGAGTEVDWNTYLTKLRATLPEGVTLTSVSVDSATPLATYDQPVTPLEGARIATLSFSAVSPTLPDVPVWLTGLRTLPAFVDAVPNSVTRDDESGGYIVDITMHVGPDAYSGRFRQDGASE